YDRRRNRRTTILTQSVEATSMRVAVQVAQITVLAFQLGLLASGCAGPAATMLKNDQGHVARCEREGWASGGGGPFSQRRYEDCIFAFQKNGYHIISVEEPGTRFPDAR